ncbi:MAG: shikimate dehydrogenase [Microbacteriaceae bacterium]|nr:shikimate dehydrogenase [Microbacteriaceae bacterium]
MKLAVLGSPIAHSQSPALHRAAYGVLGLDWEYEPIEMAADGLTDFIASRTPDWRGLSLTMPLKRDVMPLLDAVDNYATLTGVANTVLFASDAEHRTLRGFNTDVVGITNSFLFAGVRSVSIARILGAGATAASALVSLAQLGARRVVVSGRSPGNILRLIEIGEVLGVDVQGADPHGIEDGIVPDVVVSTLPGGAEHKYRFSAKMRSSAALLDVAYDPWPSPLAADWLEAGGTVVPGIEMLVNQALVQVRIFVGGDPLRALPAEGSVLAAMRRAVGLPN